MTSWYCAWIYAQTVVTKLDNMMIFLIKINVKYTFLSYYDGRNYDEIIMINKIIICYHNFYNKKLW